MKGNKGYWFGRDYYHGCYLSELRIYLKRIGESPCKSFQRDHQLMLENICDDRSFSELGRAYGLSTERIRQIVAKHLRRMRHPVRINGFRDFLRVGIDAGCHISGADKVESRFIEEVRMSKP